MRISKESVIFILSRIVAVIFLLVAYTNQQIGFYTLLRFIICLVGIYSAYSAFKTKQTIWIWLMSAIAILFNPLFPIHLERSQWEIYDAITILILLYSIPVLRISNEDEKILDKYRESTKTIIHGILIFIGGILFWYHTVGNVFDELSLIQNAKITTGTLESTYEEENEDDRGKVHISEVGVYSFHIPDGRKFYTRTYNPFDKSIEIEYLPDNPSVNRAKGDGCQSITEWLWRKIGFGGLFLVLVISPGFVLIKNGVKEMKLQLNIEKG